LFPVKKLGKTFPERLEPTAVSTYSKKIALVMVLLALAAGAVSFRVEGYPAAFGTGAVVFMALNALAALYPLYRFRGKNPFNIYMAGMMVRLVVIGLVLIVLMIKGGLSQNALLAVTLTAMFSFIAYLTVEIHHFLRHNASLLSPAK
jgi:hypothetical protein